jgi:hypothetical protein
MFRKTKIGIVAFVAVLLFIWLFLTECSSKEATANIKEKRAKIIDCSADKYAPVRIDTITIDGVKFVVASKSNAVSIIKF